MDGTTVAASIPQTFAFLESAYFIGNCAPDADVTVTSKMKSLSTGVHSSMLLDVAFKRNPY